MRAVSLAMTLVVFAACGLPEPDLKVRASVEQLQVTHAQPGTALEVHDKDGKTVATGTADDQGSLVFRHLTPGEGYRVYVPAKEPEETQPLTVMSVESSLPKPDFYSSQKLVAGFNYITTRDGTTLSAWVTLPPGKGPFPTVVNYSGYDPSRPQDPDPDTTFLCGDFPVLCTPPTDGTALIAGMLGYATVSVNMRGTGCSGGAYDYFEKLQVLDGYDIIETVGAQDWALHHKVGMVGLSYPGISQLFVASSQPPSLAAIAPMSVIGSSDSTLLPGGILNDGFALNWVNAVLKGAVPYGQGWEQKQVDAGDTVCAENQLLHSQYIDNVQQARETKFYDPALHDSLNPTTFVDRIQVPVFFTSQWQDEETGPYFFMLLDKFTGAPAKRLMVTNGVHIDGLSPVQLIEWQTFLELFVAQRKPVDPVRLRNLGSLLYNPLFGAPVTVAPSRFSDYASYDEALAAWKAEQPVQVLFEAGAGDTRYPGAPVANFEQRFPSWPPAQQQPTTLYLEPDGTLGDAAPTAADSASAFTLDPDIGSTGIVAHGGDIWALIPQWDWKQPKPGSAVVAESAPMADDTLLLGSASADLWLDSPVDDADLQVTLSEVRLDGKEQYLQSGWLRASYGKAGPKATALWPAQTMQEGDWSPLVAGADDGRG